MGVLGGVYVWKVENGEIDYGNDCNSMIHLIFTLVPIPCSTCFSSFLKSNKGETKNLAEDPKTNAWTRKVEFCLVICVVAMTCCVTMAYYHTYHGWFSPWIMKFVTQGFSFTKIIAYYALHHCFVMMSIGICLGGNASCTSKVFGMRLLRFIGKMSFHLYVIHPPLLEFLRLSISQHLISTEFKALLLALVPMLAGHVMRKAKDESIQLLLK